MALSAMVVPTTFTANDRFSSVINTMTKNTKTFASGVSRLNNRINNEMSAMTRVAKYAAIAGGTALFYKAGEDVIEYEKAIASLSAVTGTAVGSMSKQIESLGNSTKMSVIDVAGAFEIVGSKMSQYLKNPEALQSITDASITLSRASRMELEPAIASLTTMMNLYQLSAKDAAYAVNKLSAGETIGSKSIAETADIIPQFGAQAVRANVSLAESIALVQTLAQSLPTEGIGRGLRNILFDISSTKTWDKNRWKAIKMAGVDFEFVTNNANKLVDRLRELRKIGSVKGGTELFFKRVNSIAANTLFQNFDNGETSLVTFLKKIDELNDAEAKAAKNMSNLSAFIDKLKASFTNFIVTNNNSNAALSITKSLVGWMTDNMGNLVNLVASVAVAFLGWKAIVLVVSLVSGIVEGFSLVMSFHEIVMAGAALANVSYATSLGAVAVALWTAYWPFLAVAGILGLLVYAFWDSGNAADDMVSKQVSALSKGNAAVINSTKILDSELQKQTALMDKRQAEKEQRQIAELTKNTPANLKEYMLSNITSADLARLDYDSFVQEEALKNKPEYFVPNLSEKITNPLNPNAISTNPTPNLAGARQANDFSEIKKYMEERTININLNDPSGIVKDVNSDNPKGIKAHTSTTTGVKKI